MNCKIPPKIAVINSFAGYGRCSTTEALPIISAMRAQACPVPTAIFSNHTGFPSHYGVDFTEHMKGYLEQWEALGLTFDGIYCGYLGKKEQLLPVSAFLARQRQRGCPVILVDPVMGDHGKAYKAITADHCTALRELVGLADIITPNITEACLLTGTPYWEGDWPKEELEALCHALHGLGPGKVVITGLEHRSGSDGAVHFANFLSERQAGSAFSETACIVTPAAGPSRHGTGDIFASIVAADAVMGSSLSSSVQKAADFISACIRTSEELCIPEQDGVCFENLLSMLF